MEPTENITIPTNPEQPKQKKSLLKRIKKWAIIVGVTLSILLITGIILAYVFEKDIKKYAIQEINKQLTAKVVVNEKDIRFSFISKFPKASLTFKNLLILEENKKDSLVFSDKLSLEFGIFSILAGDYTVNEIDVNKTNINLRTNIDGKPNYIIWKTTPDTTTTETPFKFDLKELNLKNVTISYADEKSKFNTGIDFKNTTFSGKFTEKKSSIKLSSEHFINHLTVDSTSIFKNKNSTANLDFSITNKTNTIDIEKGDFSLEKMLLDVTGNYNLNDNSYKLKTKTKNLAIADVFTLLPQPIAEKLATYKTEGIVNGEGLLTKIPENKTPKVSATFNLTNGSLTEASTGAKITNLGFNGSYKLTPNTQNLEILKFSGDLSGGKFDGNAKLIGKNKMSLFSKFNANLDLKKLAEFLNFENIENFEGTLIMNNDFRGTVTDGNFYVSEFSGKTDIKNVSLKLIGKKYSLANLTGDFNFNRYTSTGTFKGMYGSSDFSVSTQVKNIMQYLLNDEILNVSTYIQSNQLILDEVFMLANKNAQQTDNSNPTDTVFRLPQKVMTNISAKVVDLRYGKHEFKQFKGNVLISPDKISSSNISFKSNKGIYALSGILNGKKDGSYTLTADAVCSQIDIHDFFNRFNNFGQNILEARHIKGTTDATINLTADLTSALTINTKTLQVTTDFTISNGELINFEMFDEMAEYIKSNKIANTFVKVDMLAEKLKHVYFDEMTNQLIIRDERIILPDMIIKSSVMDIGCYGGQTFEGAINYGVNFRLRDVLTKQQSSEFGYIQDDGSGTRMFISIEGTVDEPVYRLDKAAKRRYAEKKKIEEKNNLKSLLKKEFGFFKKDTTVQTNSFTNSQPEDNGPKFEVEWEEEEENKKEEQKKTNTSSQKEEQEDPEKKKKKGWLQKLVGGDKDKDKEKTTFEIEE